MRKRLSLLSVSGLVLAGGWLTVCSEGCAPSEANQTFVNSTVTKDQMVKRIQDEKFMPADQKAAALARLGARPVIDSKMAKP